MPQKGRHPDKALSPARVRQENKPGRYADGNGLYLVVEPSGTKYWVQRIVVQGRRRELGLGGVRLVSLADAREQAVSNRKVARDGGDPLLLRRQSRIVVPTFATAAETVHDSHRAGWRNPKHADQWINTLRQYAFPQIGAMPVDRIETADLLRVLTPIWLTKPETARRVRQRLAAVFDWATAAGHRAGVNPVQSVAKGLPRQTDRTAHLTALPFSEVPAFIRQLRNCDAGENVRLAFELLVLTATRTSEVLCARWPEFDIEAAVWTIPAQRMKGHREHRVPLAPASLAVLRRARELAPEGDVVFPGRKSNVPLSNMVFLMALRRMERDITAHGFRSAFRDWSAETTNFPRDVCEMALAHAVRDKTEAAYRRGDLFEKRQELMTAWASFVSPTHADNLIEMPRVLNAAIIAREALYLADRLHAALPLHPDEERRLASLSPAVQTEVRNLERDSSRYVPPPLRPGSKARRGNWPISPPSRPPGHGRILEVIAEEAGCSLRVLRRRMGKLQTDLERLQSDKVKTPVSRKREKGKRYA